MSSTSRSPLGSVARSVVMGAAMISPTLLQDCTKETPSPPPTPTGTGGAPDTTSALPRAPEPPVRPADASAPRVVDAAAPPTTVVRPRVDAGLLGPEGLSGIRSMPTRGFAGGRRPQRA